MKDLPPSVVLVFISSLVAIIAISAMLGESSVKISIGILLLATAVLGGGRALRRRLIGDADTRPEDKATPGTTDSSKQAK